MPNNFQQTVNLREKMKRAKLASQASRSGLASQASRSGQINRVYDNENGENVKEDLQKINQPKIKQVNEYLTKRIVIFLAIILIGVVVYWLFFNKEQEEPAGEISWYAIKLVNGEVYYGQISNPLESPVVISNVYYNYDQDNSDIGEVDETGSIKLVKRGSGSETHGPSGTMYIYQAVYTEPMKEDSKVLKAILEYEK